MVRRHSGQARRRRILALQRRRRDSENRRREKLGLPHDAPLEEVLRVERENARAEKELEEKRNDKGKKVKYIDGFL
jgi:small-conductance mechanosensitive channel